MTQALSLAFDPDPRELGGIRDFARQAAEELGAPVDPEILAVVVGELAANAVVHQDGPAHLELELLADGLLEVSVHDGDAALPRLVEEAPWSASGHRGIQLVAALADSWGVEETGSGKRVWARLRPEAPPVP